MILENTFCSIGDMVDHIFPFLKRIKKIILRIYWPTIERIKSLENVPLLFIVGLNDEIVPGDHTQRLYDAADKAPLKRIHRVVGGMHNDTWFKGGKDYIYTLKDFMEACIERKRTQMQSGNNNNSEVTKRNTNNNMANNDVY